MANQNRIISMDTPYGRPTPKGLELVGCVGTYGPEWNCESAETVYLYTVESQPLWEELHDMSPDERREFFHLTNDSDYPYAIPPGAVFSDWSVEFVGTYHIAVIQHLGINC